jgi:hypothetical protein
MTESQPTPETDPTPDTEVTAEAPAEEPAPMNRRDRRAAARGGPAPKILGPAAGRAPAPPVRHRDYASRKRG